MLTIMQLQPFNDTLTRMVTAVPTCPGLSVNLIAASTLVPFLQSLYGNTTRISKQYSVWVLHRPLVSSGIAMLNAP